MAEITAAAVKALRDKTQLPMMKCKKALADAQGDETVAMELLRKEGEQFIGSRGDRSTEEGRIDIQASIDPPVGAMIELQCESAQVASNEEFVQLANDLTAQLVANASVNTPDDLWACPSPSKEGMTLSEHRDELVNKIREVFRLERIIRVDGSCGSYVHHDGKTGVLLQVEGGTPELAKDICMHVAAMRPAALNPEQLDPELVAKEREILTEAARQGGKPDNIIEKIVDGQMRKFYAERTLTEQAFVKDDKQTVGKYAESGGMKIVGFTRWTLGESE